MGIKELGQFLERVEKLLLVLAFVSQPFFSLLWFLSFIESMMLFVGSGR